MPQASFPETAQPAAGPSKRETPSLIVSEAADMLMEADYEAKMAVIDNLKPSEREIKLRKEAQKAARKKAEDRKTREEEAKEARQAKDDLERCRNLMV